MPAIINPIGDIMKPRAVISGPIAATIAPKPKTIIFVVLSNPIKDFIKSPTKEAALTNGGRSMLPISVPTTESWFNDFLN